MTLVVGLDPGTVSGYCVRDLETGEVVEVGEWSGELATAAPTLGREADPEGMRYIRLHGGLFDLLDRLPIRGAIIERTHSNSKRATEVLGGVVAVFLLAVEAFGVEYDFLHTSTMHAHARTLGIEPEENDRGDEKMKEGMRRHVSEIMGRDVTDNESDAWWLVEWYLAR